MVNDTGEGQQRSYGSHMKRPAAFICIPHTRSVSSDESAARARSSAGSTAFQRVEGRDRSRSRERQYLDAPEGSRLGVTHLQDLILEYTNELATRARESSNEAGGP